MTNLPALQGMSKEDIAITLGLSSPKSSGGDLATLRLNYQKSKEIDGVKHKLTKGIWTIFNGVEDVYGTDLNTQILAASHQVREWDAKKEEYAAETIFFDKGWDDKPEDTSGGYRCGKLKSKQLEGLSEDELTVQRNKKFYKGLFGIANLSGLNAQGDEAIATDIPFIMRVRGKGFMPLSNYLKAFDDDKLACFDYVTEWDIQEGDHPTTDYWIPMPKRGESVAGIQDEDVMATLAGLIEYKDKFNADVIAQYDKANNIVSFSNAIDMNAVVDEEDVPF